MVKAIIDLAHTMNLDVMAVGVEDKMILEKLIQLGCPTGQGFYFSPAVKAEDFELLLSKHGHMARGAPSKPNFNWQTGVIGKTL